jgi:hypothetical protein
MSFRFGLAFQLGAVFAEHFAAGGSGEGGGSFDQAAGITGEGAEFGTQIELAEAGFGQASASGEMAFSHEASFGFESSHSGQTAPS